MIGDIRDILTLDDHNDYVIVSKVNYENKFYYYLVDIHNPENLKFCCEDNDKLVEVTDKKLNTKLLALFYATNIEGLSSIPK